MSLSSRAAVWSAIGLSSFALAPSSASAALMNFNNLAHGEIVNGQYALSKGVTIRAANFQGGPNLALAFDTHLPNTADFDLEHSYKMGNLDVGTHLPFKALLIAENAGDADRNGLIDSPDDQGSQPHLGSSGQLTFDFLLPQQSLGIDLIDVENGDYTVPSDVPTAFAAGDQVGFIAFHLLGVEVRRVSLGEFVDPSSQFFNPTVVYGDKSINRIEPMTAQELNIIAYDKLVIDMGMCYAIDNLEFQPFTGQIPEPSGLALMGLTTALLARRRRTR